MAEENSIVSPEQETETLTPALSSEEASQPDEAAKEPSEEASEEPRFEDWGLRPELLEALLDMGYVRPMEVQTSVFERFTAGADLMVQSRTGSGKTAAFGIPICQMLDPAQSGVQTLILAPTRELALQVARELERITARMEKLRVVPVYGGAAIGPQIRALREGAQIVAGTPGRVLDHLRRKTLDPSGIRMLVLDECDEMLSMGFQEEIENIIRWLPSPEHRQTLLFSATIPEEIERIGRRHMRDPEKVSLSDDSIGALQIDHYYYVVSGMARTRDLLKVMKAEKPESAIVFCNTREDTSSVAKYLGRHGYDAEAISSDLSQHDRERVMKRMRDGNLHFLVATDIAARGIDISGLSHVINYTFPESPEVYVHRTGRTGRAGKEGVALSLVGPREIGSFYYLKLIYKIIPEERELPSSEELAALQEGERYQEVVAAIEEDPGAEYRQLARRLWQSSEGERVVAALLRRLLSEPASKARETAQEEHQHAPQEEEGLPRSGRRARGRGEEAARNEEAPRSARGRRRRRSRDEDSSNESPAAMESAESGVPSSDEESTERPRKRRRRRRSRDEESRTENSAVGDESGDVESVSDEDAPARARRGRRRRRSRDEESRTERSEEGMGAEAGDLAATQEHEASLEEEPAADQAAPADSASEPKNGSEDDEGAAAQGSLDESEERPRRKRRRRSRRREANDTSSAADDSETPSTTSAQADAGTRENEEQPERNRARGAKPQTDHGGPREFWEAWADDKDDRSARDESMVDDDAPKRKSRTKKRPSAKNSGDSKEKTTRLFVNVGKREEASADDIRSLLAEAIGKDADAIGSIALRNTHAYVRVPEELVEPLIDACEGLSFGDREVVVERARR